MKEDSRRRICLKNYKIKKKCIVIYMLVVKRKSAGCGFNIVSSNKNYKRLSRGKLSGCGVNHDLMATPSKKFEKNISKIGEGVVRAPKVRKYISLNL